MLVKALIENPVIRSPQLISSPAIKIQSTLNNSQIKEFSEFFFLFLIKIKKPIKEAKKY